MVVGAGLTGITAAYLLKQAGVRVALLERDRIAAGDTSRTTAHLTYVTDVRLPQLADTFGRDAAQALWEAGAAAIDAIVAMARQTHADLAFAGPPALRMPRWGSRTPPRAKDWSTTRNWPGRLVSTPPSSSRCLSCIAPACASRIKPRFIRCVIWNR